MDPPTSVHPSARLRAPLCPSRLRTALAHWFTPRPEPPQPRRGGSGPEADKNLDRGLTFNGSQRWSCSATHETPTQNQVVYESFSTGFSTNLRCDKGERGDALSAAPRFRSRTAFLAGPGAGYPGPIKVPRRCGIVPSRRDSDLEAFSHNPADGSFAPVAPQPSTRTKCLNLRFLSY